LIERLIVLSPGKEITLENLPDVIYVQKPRLKQGTRLKEAIEETERQLLEETYRNLGSWKKVAEILGVDRATVFRKANKYQLIKN